MRHDLEVTALFENRGWRVLRIWECELRKKKESCLLERLKQFDLITIVDKNAE